MKKVKRSVGQYWNVDFNSDDYTHVIYEAHEYIRMKDEHTLLERQFSTYKIKKGQEFNDLKTAHNREIYALEQDYQNEIERLQDELDQYKKQCLELANSNKNLSRITRERGNAEREMTPKKKLLGYVLLSMEQTTFLFRPEQKNSKTKTVPLPCWKVRLQTPFESRIEAVTIQHLVSDDFMSNLASMMGVNKLLKNDAILTISMEELTPLWSDFSLVIKTSYKLNTISGFWEVDYLVNRPIRVLPEMLPVKKKKSEH